ncbi:MAG TPA: magnesium transporter, partial [Chroococcales cyanobacterium]
MTEGQVIAPQQLTALVDDGQRQQLRLLLNEQHPADLAEWLSEMDAEHRLSCFRLLDLDNASAVLSELELENQRALLTELGDIGVVPIISKMSPDDAVDLLAELPAEKARSIINQMADLEAAEDIQELMTFKDDSAGGIMSTDYLALNAKMTVEQALAYLREEYEDIEEEIYDLYVVDQQDHLVGELSLKELITADSEALVESLMETSFISVTTSTDQEEAAEKLSRYDLLTLPVVDEKGRLRGIITADDVIDVIEEEATEDLYQSSGINPSSSEPSEMVGTNVRSAFQARLPWLLATLMIESCSASVITHFDHVIQQTVAAASFMPLLSGVTGSVATQSTCIIIRGSSKNDINWRAAARNLLHESKVGMLLGITCGVVTGLVSTLFHSNHDLGLIVGLSLFITMTVGVLIGTAMPMIFQRLGVEPAHASG